jgi:hypothetical protein
VGAICRHEHRRQDRLELSKTGTAQMALRFTATGGASQIDDVFVDPRL